MAQHEEDLEQLKYLYTAYTKEYEAVIGEMNNFMMISSAFDRNVEALERIKTMENTNMLIGLEGGTFIEVSTKQIHKVLTNVGAGYLVEKSVENAKEFVEKNNERIQLSVNQLMSQKQKLEKEIIDLSYKINSMDQHQH